MSLDGEQLPSIQGPRVRLRWLSPADTSDVFAIFSDPEVAKYWSSLPMEAESEAANLIESVHRKFAEHSLYQWGLVTLAEDRVIGTVTLASLDLSNRRAEVGFALARAAWGRGYMREAVRVALGFAFDTLELLRIEADVDPRNARSLALLEDLGFVREGLLRERWRVGGGAQDSVMLGLLRREWPDAQSRA